MPEHQVVSFVEYRPVRMALLEGTRDAQINGTDMLLPLRAVMIHFPNDTVVTVGLN